MIKNSLPSLSSSVYDDQNSGDSLRYLLWTIQAVGALLFLFLPLWAPDSLALAKQYPYLWFYVGDVKHYNFPALLALVGGVMAVFSQIADKRLMALEFKGVVSDREFVEAYSGVLDSCMLAMKASSGMNAEQLVHARRQVLHGIRLVVAHYYDKAEKLDINACYMVAHPANSAPVGIEKRLKFWDKRRRLDTYGHFLDLVLWAEDHGELPKEFAIPVEKVDEPNMSLRQLPGAPAAFAMNRVYVVEDTRKLKRYFEEEAQYVDREIVGQELDFFASQKFRSFASLPLGDDDGGEMKGVLNLQSGRTSIFGKNNCDQEVVTKLLKPLLTALRALI
jgi:hypothetical protein